MKARKLRVPAEIGTFVALECAERLLEGPALVTMKDVRLSDEGIVSIYVTPRSASAEASAQSLVSMLAGLLVAAGTAVPTPLIGIVESGGPSGPDALTHLRDMLEAALVPLNRQAARRVLSRMIREARRPSTERPPPLPSGGPSGGVDDDLDSLLGDAPSLPSHDGRNTAPYPQSFDPGPIERSVPATEIPRAEVSRREATDEQTAPLPTHDAKAPAFPNDPVPAPVEPLRPPAAPIAQPIVAPAPAAPPPQPPQRAPTPTPTPAPEPARPAPRRAVDEEARRPRPIELADDPPTGARGGGVWLVLASLIALVAVGALYFATQRPELVDQMLGRPSADEIPDAAVAPLPEPEAGTLDVESTPDEAQAFLFVGRGPTVIEDLPVGVAHEFLVIADGHRPQRVIVPADARYEDTPDGPRYELAAQVGAALSADEDPLAVDLGPSLMPSTPGTPGDLGSVRVITNPPGAKVFMLIGFTPQVHVENLATSTATELMLWHEGHRLERIVVGPSDWQGEGSHQEAHIRATLTELRRR
ncbi:MAG: hypothetical protein J0L92_28255 [Deltaproteobacteria bacterium]|nr:hypothetical protein [Deltaproteobacteria bacterium]